MRKTVHDKRSIVMDSHPSAEIDPEQLAQAQAFWHNFIFAAKIGIVAVALLLIAMDIGFEIL
jgi:hypothetical protein